MQFWQGVKSIVEYSVFHTDWARLVLAFFILLLSLVLRQIFVKFVGKSLKRMVISWNISLEPYFSGIVEAPARFLIIILGIWAAVSVIDFPDKSQVLIDRILRSLLAYSVFKAAYKASDAITLLIGKIAQKSAAKLDDMLLLFMRKSLKALILVIGAVTVVQEWYDNIGGLLAGLGLGGLAVALAAKDTVANLFGSITIMIDKPFAIGDWITTPQMEGTIEEIGFRSTRVRTFSQAVITIPNSMMSNEPITNWSRMGKRRVSFRIGLRYGTPVPKMKEFMDYFKERLKSHPDIHPQTIVVTLERLSDSGMEILFYFFTQATDWQKYLSVQEELNFQIIAKLSEMGLQIAYPARSVYFEENTERERIDR